MEITYSLNKNLNTEANRLFFILNQVVTGFYQEKRFRILPSRVDGSDIIYLPELPFQSLTFFPEGLREDIVLGKEDPRMIEEIEGMLSSQGIGVSEVNLSSGFLDDFMKEYSSLIENFFFDLPSSIHYTIFETDYGSVASWNKPVKVGDGKYEIMIFIRSDVIKSNLLEALFSPVMRYILKNKISYPNVKSKWNSYEIIIDYLLSSTKLSQLSDKFVPTIKDEIRLEDPNIYEKSSEYYRNLGFPVQSIFELVDSDILLGSEPINGYLTTKENLVMAKLLENKGNIVTYEDIAKCLWDDDWSEKYSLWSIAKIIEKIRTKLANLNVSRNIILTRRGMGYQLWD